MILLQVTVSEIRTQITLEISTMKSFLNHFNGSTVAPNLWGKLAIPSEGQNIGTRFDILWDLHVIFESPASFWYSDFGPF